MLQIIIGTVIYVAISALIKTEEVAAIRAQKECEETDWNEYYANM